MLRLDKPEFSWLVDRNPGAITVLNELSKSDAGLSAIEVLAAKDIIGWRLWYLYKYCCKYSVELLIKKVLTNDKAMFSKLLKEESIIEMNDKLLGG